MQALIEGKADLNVREDQNGDTALMKAAQLSEVYDIVVLLLDSGADAKLKNYNGKTAYQMAKSNNGSSLTTLLLSKYDPEGIKLNAEKKRQQVNVKLFQAARSGDVSVLKTALQEGAEVSIHYDDIGVGYSNDYGNKTPIEVAVSQNNNDAVKVLLEAGADPNQATGMYTLLYISTTQHNKELIQLLASYGTIPTRDGGAALIRAAEYEPYEIVKALIEVGVDVNFRDDNGNTPLIEAVERAINDIKSTERIDIVKALIQAYADPNLKNNKGRSALDYAKSYSELVEILEQ